MYKIMYKIIFTCGVGASEAGGYGVARDVAERGGVVTIGVAEVDEGEGRVGEDGHATSERHQADERDHRQTAHARHLSVVFLLRVLLLLIPDRREALQPL